MRSRPTWLCRVLDGRLVGLNSKNATIKNVICYQILIPIWLFSKPMVRQHTWSTNVLYVGYWLHQGIQEKHWVMQTMPWDMTQKRHDYQKCGCSSLSSRQTSHDATLVTKLWPPRLATQYIRCQTYSPLPPAVREPSTCLAPYRLSLKTIDRRSSSMTGDFTENILHLQKTQPGVVCACLPNLS